MEMSEIKNIVLGILVFLNLGLVFWFYNAATRYLLNHQKKMAEIEDDYKKAHKELLEAETATTQEYIEILKQFVADCKRYREEHHLDENRRDPSADIQSGEVEN